MNDELNKKLFVSHIDALKWIIEKIWKIPILYLMRILMWGPPIIRAELLNKNFMKLLISVSYMPNK